MHRSPSTAPEREARALQTIEAVAIIPARLGSTRIPEKPLQDLCGAPLVVRVLERVRACRAFARVLVATESPRIAAAVRDAGGEAVLTRPDHASGLDRVAEAAGETAAEVIVNVQGDEPFVRPEGLERLVSLLRDPSVPMATLASPFPAGESPEDPNRVKVVIDREGRALYFSRALIPHGAGAGVPPLLHVGVYAYRRETLARLAALEPAPPERAERLEQLRALWNGIAIHVAVGAYASLGIDTPEDLTRARQRWAEGRNRG